MEKCIYNNLITNEKTYYNIYIITLKKEEEEEEYEEELEQQNVKK